MYQLLRSCMSPKYWCWFQDQPYSVIFLHHVQCLKILLVTGVWWVTVRWPEGSLLRRIITLKGHYSEKDHCSEGLLLRIKYKGHFSNPNTSPKIIFRNNPYALFGVMTLRSKDPFEQWHVPVWWTIVFVIKSASRIFKGRTCHTHMTFVTDVDTETVCIFLFLATEQNRASRKPSL